MLFKKAETEPPLPAGAMSAPGSALPDREAGPEARMRRAITPLRDGGMLPRTDVAAGSAALGAGAVGALALGACALGAVAVGALAIGRLSVGRARIGEAEIGRLRIGRLEVESFAPARQRFG
ncbi:hypothetical protein [Jiella avicenniae]|uniref:Uncharacterized protein n=1 Tax=Jiella avicenniae TaxID=2907202 RepID=A0A9X1T534_9HYPH|nr:hypothetical protein [Jiella avicenniae]MCE7027650.1 hypothetical protein [Jiella avicenniae]MCE7028692.1 hypothetical protein [Jiella avicenniae]